MIDPRNNPPPLEWEVSVNRAGVAALARRWEHRVFPPAAFDYPGLPRHGQPGWFDFCVLAVSVVACLWPPEGEEMWHTFHEGEWLDDAPGLFACFTRATDVTPGSFVDFDVTDAGRFFAGRGVLQMLAERAERLAGVASALTENWNGQAANLVEEAGWDARRVVELLVGTIPGYADRSMTRVGTVVFDKLAHLCASMINARSPRPLTGLDTFPVYPDYMLPRVLRFYRILEYQPDLAAAVDGRRLIPPESEWETAIRWGTVYAAEQLGDALNRIGNPVSIPALDYALWHDAVLGEEASEMGEHHRTLTMTY